MENSQCCYSWGRSLLSACLGRWWSDFGGDFGLNYVENGEFGLGVQREGKSDYREQSLKALLVWKTGRTWVSQQARDLFIAHLT